MESIDKIDKRIYLGKLTKKREIAKEASEFTFELERAMEYEPGQYVWVEIPHMSISDLKGNRRAFSIADISEDGKFLSIIFRTSRSGFNESLRALHLGDELNIIGPFGSSFLLPKEADTPLVLIAGGVGVSPFVSLLKHSVKIKSQREIVLITANDSRERAPYVEELETLVQDLRSIKIISLTKRIAYEDIENIFKISNALVYISGLQGFVDDVHHLLKMDGIFEHQFHFEAYYPSDVTDRRVAELFLDGHPKIESTEPEYVRLRTILIYGLVNYSATHTIVTDVHGRIIFANQAAQDATGYSLSEMLWQTPRLWGGMMPKAFYEELWKMKLHGDTFNGEVINRRKNGDIYIASTHIAPIKDEKGAIIGYVGSEEDITHLRRAEQQAIENEQRFVQLTERISEVYWIIEVRPTIQVAYVSPTFEKIWGIPRSLLYHDPNTWMENIHGDDRRRVSELFELFLKNKALFDIEFRVVRPDSSMSIVHAEGEHVLDDKGNVSRVFGMVRDVTMERTIDKEKTEFVSFASHQLKTPITAIRWNIESLLAGKYGDLQAKQKEVLQGIHTMNSRIDELISNLLNVSRIEQGVFLIEPIQVSFIQICEEVLMEMEPYAIKKNHTLIKDFDKGLPSVPADSKLLRIIFQNFISNAIKYTPEKGKIIVSIKVVGADIVFSVANNGEPIPMADQPRIFQKMFRASNAREQDPGGTGLGLYIVKEIVENGGGKVWFTSKKGEETAFFTSFPLTGMVSKGGSKALT